jgi:hypothetical protein
VISNTIASVHSEPTSARATAFFDRVDRARQQVEQPADATTARRNRDARARPDLCKQSRLNQSLARLATSVGYVIVRQILPHASDAWSWNARQGHRLSHSAPLEKGPTR